jgi:Xaa-Pro aminopeptidase
MTTPSIMAGAPTSNFAVYHRLRFQTGDTIVCIDLGGGETYAIMRDIEMGRAKEAKAARHIHCPPDFAPAGGLSGDREIGNAQAAAELLVQKGVGKITADRSLPFLYVHHLQERGIEVVCDAQFGLLARRMKDDWEVAQLRKAQDATEQAIRRACETIANASADAKGVLQHEGEALTSERVRFLIELDLMKQNFSAPPSIVISGPAGADCHDLGSGDLRTGEPIIIDVFPRDRATLYNGDCTRSVVHGDIPEEVARMHQDVLDAKVAAEAVSKVGTTGEEVHQAACEVFVSRGRRIGLPAEGEDDSLAFYTHGTGHGIGLEVHETPLLDRAGPPLVEGDALTVEPGLYCKAIGGIRVEDMVIVRKDGCENLNTIDMGLVWK